MTAVWKFGCRICVLNRRPSEKVPNAQATGSRRHLAEIRFTDLPARLPTLALASKSTIETRKPPLWDDGDAQVDDGVQIEPTDWDLAAQPAPDFEVDQRINW